MPFLPWGMGMGKMSRIPPGGGASQWRVRADGDRIPQAAQGSQARKTWQHDVK